MRNQLSPKRAISLQLIVAAGLLAAFAIPLRGADATDAPKTDAPKIEAPKIEAPKIDAPKIDAPKIDAPKTIAPKTFVPKTVASETNASKTRAKPAAGPKRIKQTALGPVVLNARDVVIHGKVVRYEPDKNTIGYWSKQSDWVSWNLEITHPDEFLVEMELGCGAGSGGSHFTVEIAGQKLEDKVPDTGSFHTFSHRKIGTIKIDKPGNYTLAIHVEDKPGIAVMDLRTVTLMPAKLAKLQQRKLELQLPGLQKPAPRTPTAAKPSPPAPNPTPPGQH